MAFKSNKTKPLERYLESLQMLTDVVGEVKANKDGVILVFKRQYGGGEVRFPNSKEMNGFITAFKNFVDDISK